MPFETLSCSHCGSGDVQQVKPETYFCNHCDTVFRFTNTTATSGGMPVGCQIELNSSDTCGVTAIGRCRTCRKAFCPTHQAKVATERLHHSEIYYQRGSGYPDWCGNCRRAELVVPIIAHEEKLAEVGAARARELRELRESALAALRAYGFARIAQPRSEKVWIREKKAFGRERSEEVEHPLEPAVFIGDLKWRFQGWRQYYGSVDRIEEYPTGITESGEIVHMNFRESSDHGLAFKDPDAVGEALWKVLERHGIKREPT